MIAFFIYIYFVLLSQIKTYMDLDIYNITHNHVKPESGKVLLSVPFINDTFFSRAVILITMHDSEGTVGYILNKKLPVLLHELIDDVPKSNFSIGIGGPVGSDTLQMLHCLGDTIPNSIKISNGLYWGGDFDIVKSLINKGEVAPNQIRFFMGYSGWSVDQLNQEITSNSWLVTDITTETILTQNDENLWRKSLIKMGDKYKTWADFPLDPTLN